MLLLLIVLLIAARVSLLFLVKDNVNKTLKNLDGYTGLVKDVDLSLYGGAYVIHKLSIQQTGNSIPVPFFDIQKIDLSVHGEALLKVTIIVEIILNWPTVNFAIAKNPDYKGDNKVCQDGSDEDWTQVLDDLIP